MVSEDKRTTVLRANLSVRWDTLFFPFPPILLARALPTLKYVLPDDVTKWEGIRPNVDIESGVIGRKGSIAIQISTDRNYVSVHSRDLSVLVTEFDQLEDLLLSDLQFDSRQSAWFYEIVASLTLPAGKNPVKAWHEALVTVPLVQQASDIIGADVGPFGMRLTTRFADPNQVDWTDVKLEPMVQSAGSLYGMDVIYRRQEREDVIRFLQRLLDVGHSLTELIEGQES